MKVILDASAGIEIVLSRSKAHKLCKILSNSKKVISSDLYKIEIANVLWKYVKAGFLEPEKTNNLLSLAMELVDEFIDISKNNEEAMREAMRLNHSTYDLLYFTLARRYGATLITLDRKLNQICRESGISIMEYD